MGSDDALAQLGLEHGRGEPLVLQYVLVGVGVETTVPLKGGLGQDLDTELLIGDAQTHTVGRIQQQGLADHVVEHLLTQALVVELQRVVGCAETLAQLDAGLLDASIEFAVGDLVPVDLGRDRLATDLQIGLDAPEGERNTDEDDDDPGDPAVGAIPDGLQHVWILELG